MYLEGLVEVEAPDEAALLLPGQRHLEQGLLCVQPVRALSVVVVVVVVVGEVVESEGL